MTHRIKAIDIVVNPLTSEIIRMRPSWTKGFFNGKIGREDSVTEGITHEQMLAMMDRAGIEIGWGPWPTVCIAVSPCGVNGKRHAWKVGAWRSRL